MLDVVRKELQYIDTNIRIVFNARITINFYNAYSHN